MNNKLSGYHIPQTRKEKIELLKKIQSSKQSLGSILSALLPEKIFLVNVDDNGFSHKGKNVSIEELQALINQHKKRYNTTIIWVKKGNRQLPEIEVNKSLLINVVYTSIPLAYRETDIDIN